MRKKDNHIQNLILEGEHQMLDFKFEISDSRRIARSLAAFANTDGGRLLVGVKDNGAIAGVRSDEEIHMIQAAAEMYCRERSAPATARCSARAVRRCIRSEPAWSRTRAPAQPIISTAGHER